MHLQTYRVSIVYGKGNIEQQKGMSKKVSKEETNLEWTQICNIRSLSHAIELQDMLIRLENGVLV